MPLADPRLSFIDNQKLIAFTKAVLDSAASATSSAAKKLFTNKVDPFSAVFDAMRQGLTLTEWLEQEKSRQIQKTMQNAVGEFHQNILGAMTGWTNLGIGSVVDLRNDQLHIIAEVKNKFNTTKSSDKTGIYDKLKDTLQLPQYTGYTAYYVEVIPRRRQPYDEPFTPSDNVTHNCRAIDEHIRVIDGPSFYHLASGELNALKQIYEALPEVIETINSKDHNLIIADPLFQALFDKITR